mgnify:CR=1 FL=1
MLCTPSKFNLKPPKPRKSTTGLQRSGTTLGLTVKMKFLGSKVYRYPVFKTYWPFFVGGKYEWLM